ncbi:MAG: type II toxin-antitoxin system VapC family toxin [Terriglobia bacterium]
MNIYPDTSLLVSLYVPDAHSAAAEERMRLRPRCWLTPLHRAEWAHAIERLVFQGQLSRHRASQARSDFEDDRAAGVWSEMSLPELIFELSIQLANRHAARLGNRTLDTLHVASALELKADRFWTFDDRQGKLARAEGLSTNGF